MVAYQSMPLVLFTNDKGTEKAESGLFQIDQSLNATSDGNTCCRMICEVRAACFRYSTFEV